MSNHINDIKINLAEQREKLLNHEVFQSMHTIEDLRIFMEHHVFAIWDFMSLLKALQRELTNITVPWVPKGNPFARRLINEMVLEEETELDINGYPSSFFEIYLRGMEKAEADTSQIRKLWELIVKGKPVAEAMAELEVADTIKAFVNQTFTVIQNGKVHEIAAALTLGREDVIPGMFGAFVKDMKNRFPELLGVYTYYIEKHVEMYRDVHTPLSNKMIEQLCGSNEQKWKECEEVIKACLEARINLWDGILKEVHSNNNKPKLENH